MKLTFVDLSYKISNDEQLNKVVYNWRYSNKTGGLFQIGLFPLMPISNYLSKSRSRQQRLTSEYWMAIILAFTVFELPSVTGFNGAKKSEYWELVSQSVSTQRDLIPSGSF